MADRNLDALVDISVSCYASDQEKNWLYDVMEQEKVPTPADVVEVFLQGLGEPTLVVTKGCHPIT